MRDDHLPEVEVTSKVKGVPEHVCEGSQVNNLNVGVIGTRVKKKRRGRSNEL